MPFAIFLKQSDAVPFSYFILRRNGLDPHPTQFANFYGKGATGLRIFLTEIMTAPPPRRSRSAFCVCRRTAEHRHAQSAIDLSLKDRGTLFDLERPVQGVDLCRSESQIPHSFLHLVVRNIDSGTVVQDVLHSITAVTVQFVLGGPDVPLQPFQHDLLFFFRKITKMRCIVSCLDLVMDTVVINAADYAANAAALFKSPHSVYLLLAHLALNLRFAY